MVTDDQVAAGLDARAYVSREHLYLYSTEKCKCGAEYSDSHTMRETLEYIERATEQRYEYGWAGNALAQTFFASEEEASEYMFAPKQFKRTAPGPWEEVK